MVGSKVTQLTGKKSIRMKLIKKRIKLTEKAFQLNFLSCSSLQLNRTEVFLA